MIMSETLKKSLLNSFPDGKIYEDELMKKPLLYPIVRKEAGSRGNISVLLNSNGFHWITLERNMDYIGDFISEGSITEIVNSIYDTQSLLGNAVLSEDKQEELFQYSRILFKKVINRQGKFSLQEKRVLLLEAIYLVQNRDDVDAEQGIEEEDSSLWNYLFRELSGHTIKNGTSEHTYCYNFFCNLITSTLDKTNHLRILPQKGKNKYQQYYDTLLVHAQAPKAAMFNFFRLLFDFYVNGLECQYIAADPAFKQLRNGVKSKWNENIETEVNVRSDPMGACIRTMFDFCPNFSAFYCEYLIQKIDALTSGTMSELNTLSYIDCLLVEWYRNQSREEKNTVWKIRREHYNDKVATEQNQILPFYEWNVQKGVYICIPKIRFGEEICKKIREHQGLPFVKLFCDEQLIHQENLKFFDSQGVYTSRGYQYYFGDSLPSNFHFRIMIGLSGQPNCIYDSQNNRKEFLFRNVLLFDETGHELQTIQTSRHDRVIAFIPGDSIVSFEPEYEEVWENPVGGAKCYQFDINGIHAFTVDGQDIYADETARTHFRTQIFPAKIDNARILSDNKYFDIYAKLQNITFLLPDQSYPEQYQLILDGNMSPLSLYYKEGTACLPVTNKPGLHEIKIIEVGSGNTISTVRYALLPGFQFDFEKSIYFDTQKDVKATVSLETGYQNSYTVHVNPGIFRIQLDQFPYGDFLDVDVPVISGTWDGKNLFECDQRNPIWHKDISRESHIHISCPKGWIATLWLGNTPIHHTAKDITAFDIGNQLQIHKFVLPTERLVLRMEHPGKASVFCEICSIAFQPVFMESPIFIKNNMLYWNIVDCYIGNVKGQFHLILDTAEKEYAYTLAYENEIIERNLNLPDGEYAYQIELVEQVPFLGEKCTEIHSGTLLVGDPNAFRFANSMLYLRTASYWIGGIGENEKFGIATLKPESTRICNITYLGMKNTLTGDGTFPCYCGTLQFWNQKSETWWNFNSDIRKEERYQRINPVHFWIISDHVMEMQPADEDTLDIELIHDYGIIRNVQYHLIPKSREKQIKTPDSFDYEKRKVK